MMRTRRLFRIGLLFCMVVGLFATGVSAQDSDVCPGGVRGDLVVALNADLFSSDPLMGGTIAAVNYNMAIADPLVIMGDEGPAPWLIESWEATPEGVYTWNIREGVMFHDGTPLNAEAIVYSINRLTNPDNGYRYGSYFARTQEINIIDDYTLEIVNESYDVEFMDRMINISIVSPTAFEELGADFALSPVGSGPFRFVSYTPGERAVLERNPDYWQPGKPCVETLTFRFIPEESVRLIELEAGTVHIAMDMAASAMQAQMAGLDLITTPARGQQMVYFNLSRITDPAVRRAVNLAIDRQAIVTNVYQDLSIVGYYPMPPSVWAYNENTPIYEYNVELANQILDEAGYTMGANGVRERDGQPLVWQMPVSSIPSRQQASEMVAGMLSEIGIQVELQAMEHLTHIDSVRAGNYDIAWYEWAGSTSDPWAYSGGLASNYAFNVTQFGDPELDRYLDEALVTIDRDARQQLYDDYFAIVMENAYVASVAFKPEVTAVRPEVDGIQFPGGRLLFESAYFNN